MKRKIFDHAVVDVDVFNKFVESLPPDHKFKIICLHCLKEFETKIMFKCICDPCVSKVFQ